MIDTFHSRLLSIFDLINTWDNSLNFILSMSFDLVWTKISKEILFVIRIWTMSKRPIFPICYIYIWKVQLSQTHDRRSRSTWCPGWYTCYHFFGPILSEKKVVSTSDYIRNCLILIGYVSQFCKLYFFHSVYLKEKHFFLRQGCLCCTPTKNLKKQTNK